MFSVFILVFIGCNGGPSDDGIPQISGGANSPGIWNNIRLPLDLKLSEDFLLNERDAITDMSQEWEDRIDNEIDFFTVDPSAVTNRAPANSRDFRDGEMGIYKSTNWYPEFGSNSLAVTQSFGFISADAQGAFIDMVHADIIMNYDNFTFSLNPVGGQFDLESVVLHELGHFIGMKHDSLFQNSVMVPSISFNQKRRVPTQRDEDTLRDNYRIGTSISSFVSALRIGEFTEENSKHLNIGEEVRVIIELKANGDCVHKVNGHVVHTH